MIKYTAKSGKQQFKPSFEELETAIRDDNMTGFCLACGEEMGGVEPDARAIPCECCDANKVFGAEELLLMGLYH